jgi:hypothetical protein
MTSPCDAPLSDDDLLDYWTQAIAGTDAELIEEHLFSCAACSARLETMASVGTGLAALVRRGRVSGIVSRSLLNCMQRDGVHVRLYSLSPGERVPCAAFPEDDLLVVSLRADFAGSDAVTLSVTGPDDEVIGHMLDVPVSRKDAEIFWATPGETVRQMPIVRLHLKLTSPAPDERVLAEYDLDHTALPHA